MNKDRNMRLYTNLSILIGFVLLLVTFIYLLRFPIEFYGVIETSLFNIEFSNYEGELDVFNFVLIFYLGVTLLNVLVWIFIGTSKDITKPQLKEVVVFNTMITLFMIASNVVFVLMMPNQVNGLIEDGFFYLSVPKVSSDIIKVLNFNYVLAFIYVFYNMYISVKTMPERVEKEEVEEEIDEELYEAEFYQNLEKSEENTKTEKQE